MPASRFIHLSEEEDTRLREIEHSPYLQPKARVRAHVVRLSQRGQTIRQIAAYTGRRPTSIGRDFDRWQDQGVAGLADGAAPGNPSRITAEVKTCLGERLDEDRGPVGRSGG